jgi:hypothetical protein
VVVAGEENTCPLEVEPIRWFTPSPSSAMISPPNADTVMLSGPSGSLSWSVGVKAKCSLSSIVSASASMNHTWPSC